MISIRVFPFGSKSCRSNSEKPTSQKSLASQIYTSMLQSLSPAPIHAGRPAAREGGKKANSAREGHRAETLEEGRGRRERLRGPRRRQPGHHVCRAGGYSTGPFASGAAGSPSIMYLEGVVFTSMEVPASHPAMVALLETGRDYSHSCKEAGANHQLGLPHLHLCCSLVDSLSKRE